jgi:hypothetical protein
MTNTDYESMLESMRELERLDREGKIDSPEADAVRDRSDPIWLRLTEEEKERLRRHFVEGGECD